MRVLFILSLLIVGCSTYVVNRTDEALAMRRQVSKSVLRSLNITKETVATGFVIMVGDKKVMVTNFHHCDLPPVEMEALSEQTLETYPLKPLIAFPRVDLCLVEVIGAEALPPLKLASRSAELGQTVYTLGFPHGQYLRLLEGQVEHYSLNAVPPRVQTNMWIIPGQSGSPLLNRDMEVVGVIYATNRDDHAGFAIPVEYLLNAVKELEQELKHTGDATDN